MRGSHLLQLVGGEERETGHIVEESQINNN